jgi:DNA (cytosine-5)-methyltransferase 1
MTDIPYLTQNVVKNSLQENFTVISLFAGCGGSSTGYKLAGGKILGFGEFIKRASDSYLQNYPNTPLFDQDIRDLLPEDILREANLSLGELDILDGSPPCSSFSTAGKGDKNWGKVKQYSKGVKQRTDDLFFEYIRILNGLMPKTFVIENVKGLVVGKNKIFFDSEILPKLMEHYEVQYKLCNAADYGVPQRRIRLICVGVRKDIGKIFDFSHNPKRHISVKEAISNIEQNEEQRLFLLERGLYYANSKKWFDLKKPGDKHPIRFSVRRNSWDEPSYTLLYNDALLNAAGLMHPWECRRHTIPEAKRLMGFPDDYILTGDFRDQYESLARAVAPLMYEGVADNIYKQIFSK